MDPVIGYQTARKLFKDRFGHPFKIATAHVNQVTRGPAVKPKDQRGLQTFAERALRIMEGSSKMVSGHYQIALPWRQQPPYLPNNQVLADHRLQLLKKKFLQDHKLFESYRVTIHDYISKGYA